MADNDDDAALMSALVTEHFALQSVASSTISESGSRAAIYLSVLSAGLVAIGFASASPAVLVVLVLTVLPTVFVLGLLTMVRVIDTSIENIVAQRRIALIRTYYLTLHSAAVTYFADDRRSTGIHGVRYRSSSVLFTTASMVTVVNAVLGGTTLALIAALGLHLPMPLVISAGTIAGVAILVGALGYQLRRLRPELQAD
jgi:hypothetical protein